MKYKRHLLIGAVLLLAVGTSVFAQNGPARGNKAPSPRPYLGRNQNLMEDISPDEQESLLFMWQEEKLARDVYARLAEMWNLPIFTTISRSEAQHMAAVENLLDRSNQTEALPQTLDTTPGQFMDAEFTRLYRELTEQGGASLSAALEVGISIEELDVVDLKKRLNETANPEIQRVYANLLRGSENHLRAFTSFREDLDGSITPGSGSQGLGSRGSNSQGLGSQGLGATGRMWI